MRNLLAKTLFIAAAAAFSMSASAGHHEEGEKAMDMAKEKGAEAKEAMMDKTEMVKEKHKSMPADAEMDKMKADAEAEMEAEVEVEMPE